MGSYGLGVSRVVGAVAEQTADDAGLCWPAALAPFDVDVVPVGRGEGQLSAALDMAGSPDAHGLDVLLDDRGPAAGVAFADADLLGIPKILVVGRSLSRGLGELKDRATGQRREITIPEAFEAITMASPC